MLSVRKNSERGRSSYDWLHSYHTFSFADYVDPQHVSFFSLRVINDDWVSPGAGFPTHPHRDMEIISYVLEGAMEHKDSMGNETIIHAGGIQRITAGTGITHSEYNASQTKPLHFLQIWIFPERKNLTPGYTRWDVPIAAKQGRLQLLASYDGHDGSITVHQDVLLYAALLEPGDAVCYSLKPGRQSYVHITKGEITLEGHKLESGDGARITDESELDIHSVEKAELLLFDLA